MKFFKSYHPFAMVTIFLWALAFVLTKRALRHFSPLPMGFLRYAAASLCLLAVCLVTRMKPPKKKEFPLIVAAGAAGFFLYMIAFNIGMGHVSAAATSFIIASVPVLTALLASVFFREKLAAFQWAGIVVEFAGILVLTVYGAVFTVGAGVLWLLGAAVLLSVYNLLQRKLVRTCPALTATTYSIFAGTAMLAIFLPGSIPELLSAPPVPVICVLLMGILSSAAAYIAWSKAFEKAERTSQVSNYMFFTPFITTILGFVTIGEVPDLQTWIGGGFIIAGALLFNRAELFGRRKAPAPQASAE